MSFELRAITEAEVPAFRRCVTMGFGGDYKPDDDARFLSLMPLERTVAAFDNGAIVGTLGDFDLEVTVPGGTQVEMAGTTMVTVQATHTRRGILRSMVERHLDNAVKRGEPVAGLWASEPGIYGRFGFGLASECHSVTIDTRHITKPQPAADIEITMIDADQVSEIVAPYWHKIATQRSGFIDRKEPRWQDIINDPERSRGGASAARRVVARRDGEVVGYMAYRQSGKWTEAVSHGSVSIITLFASDLDAHMSLWAYALDVDLFPLVDFWCAATDDPLAYMISEARAVRRLVSDCLYVRILDVEAALAARTYESDGEITIAVADAMGYTEGTYRLAVANGVVTVESAAPAAASVALDIRELGALYLGRACVETYAAAGRITGDREAVRTLGQLFVTARVPWCPEEF